MLALCVGLLRLVRFAFSCAVLFLCGLVILQGWVVCWLRVALGLFDFVFVEIVAWIRGFWVSDFGFGFACCLGLYCLRA